MAETRFSMNHHRRILLHNPRKTRRAATAADGYLRVSSLHSDETDSVTITEISLRGQVISRPTPATCGVPGAERTEIFKI
jgi:hypothetical protein